MTEVSNKKNRGIICLLCEDCQRKAESYGYVCKLTGEDVSQEHFALNRAKDCPKSK